MSWDYRDYDGNIANEDAKKRAIEENTLVETTYGLIYDRITREEYDHDLKKRDKRDNQ